MPHWRPIVTDTDRIAGQVRTMVDTDLPLVLQWRNHPDVRRHMFSRHDIATDEHRQWFERETADSRSHLLILDVAGVPSGFIRIREIGAGIANWGFYTAPDAPAGTGRALGRIALTHAFARIGLHKLCGQALASNERSICFHEHQGFIREGVLRQQHFNGQTYEDVVCFGLLANEWRRMHQEACDGR